MNDPLELAVRLWRGDEVHPFGASGSVPIGDDCLFIASFANVSAIRTAEGLLVIDSGGPLTSAGDLEQLRAWSYDPIRVLVLTHGHIDHVHGVSLMDEDAGRQGFERPRVIAHANLPERFARYRMTAGYNAEINRRQFQVDALEWPTEYRMPDESFTGSLDVALGGETFHLFGARGETDDHTWVWSPTRKMVFCGDLFIWSCPNAGNPQKVQRYPAEWAAALRRMLEVRPEALLPGHGPPVIGAGRVAEVLDKTATYLEHLVDTTVNLMNEGRSLNEVLHTVRPPEWSAGIPYLRAIYDEPEFIVRNVWRLYGGWFDGDPSSLKPAGSAALAREIASLSGGAGVLAERARDVFAQDPRLACHLAELAFQAAPEQRLVNEVRAELYERRARAESSTMAKGIYSWAARTSRELL